MYDVMTPLAEKSRIDCLNMGFVELIDVMPRFVPDGRTADVAIVQAARISTGNDLKSHDEDKGLLRYLLRHRHTTPFEMVEFKFRCKMPIFVARQWIRHRTANVNELSGRYSALPNEFYFPEKENLRKQSQVNKQGGGSEPISEQDATEFINYVHNLCEETYKTYETKLSKGLSKELARMILPLNLGTEWIWKIDLHNLFHFLGLRCDSHAQYEIRVFADAMLQLITPIVPLAVNAFNDYHPMRNAILLTALEVEAIHASFATGTKLLQIASSNKREREEWVAKAKKLNFDIVE